jgi:hypothetical protein
MKRTLLLAGLVLAAGMPLPRPVSAAASSGEELSAQASERRERRRARRSVRRQDAEEWRSAGSGVSADDRAVLLQAWRDSVERLQKVTPEQREQLRNGAEGIAEHLGPMTPQQRARLQQWLERSAAEYAALTAEQKQVILGNMADTIDRLRSVPPEQKAKLKALYRKLLGL